MTDLMRDALETLQYARARAMGAREYWQAVLYAMPMRLDERVQSLAVDKHARLYANPQWVLKYGRDTTATAILHEAGHVLLKHEERTRLLGVPDHLHALANECQDAELNDDLQADAAAGRIAPLPDEWCVLPSKWGLPENEAWEFYYYRALDQKLRLPPSSRCGSGATGFVGEWEVGTPRDDAFGLDEVDIRDVRSRVAQATLAYSRGRGHVPGKWIEWAVEIVGTRRIAWDALFASSLSSSILTVRGYTIETYARPSRRQSAVSGCVLPSYQDPVPEVAFIIDTSSSMAERQLGMMRSLVKQICDEQSARLTVLVVDAAVHGVKQISHDEEIEWRGRGGTDMTIGIRAALDLFPRPGLIVVATDCETEWPEEQPDVPVLVVAIGADAEDVAAVPQWATTFVAEES